MSNSSLVDYVKISPNKDIMTNKVIRKITIHHMAGNLSVETCGNVFQKKGGVSANYGIGSDGRVGLYVDEKDRSFASANRENDAQAVTMEIANDVVGGNWHVSDKALAKTIELCADICKRNGIDKLVWTGDRTGNLTVHRFFIATACPGEYLMSKMQYIADEVNKLLEPPKVDEWKHNDKGYWYEYADGTYPTSKWLKLDNEWYYFDDRGYAYRNKWLEYKDKWYYFDNDCKMVSDKFVDYKGKTYYLLENGAMAVGLQNIKDNVYYFSNDGHLCFTDDTGALI